VDHRISTPASCQQDKAPLLNCAGLSLKQLSRKERQFHAVINMQNDYRARDEWWVSEWVSRSFWWQIIPVKSLALVLTTEHKTTNRNHAIEEINQIKANRPNWKETMHKINIPLIHRRKTSPMAADPAKYRAHQKSTPKEFC